LLGIARGSLSALVELLDFVAFGRVWFVPLVSRTFARRFPALFAAILVKVARGVSRVGAGAARSLMCGSIGTAVGLDQTGTKIITGLRGRRSRPRRFGAP
jgi:hypothetical protein